MENQALQNLQSKPQQEIPIINKDGCFKVEGSTYKLETRSTMSSLQNNYLTTKSGKRILQLSNTGPESITFHVDKSRFSEQYERILAEGNVMYIQLTAVRKIEETDWPKLLIASAIAVEFAIKDFLIKPDIFLILGEDKVRFLRLSKPLAYENTWDLNNHYLGMPSFTVASIANLIEEYLRPGQGVVGFDETTKNRLDTNITYNPRNIREN